MANSDKNIVITPNIGSTTADPRVVFSGASSTLGPQNITLQVYPTNNGTLSFEGSAGQLFSITNSLSGTIFSVNDVSGIPSIEVLDTGTVKIAQYNGRVLIGTGTDNGVDKLQISGDVLATNFKGNATTANALDGVSSLTLAASNRANRIITGGGTITVDVSNNVKWTSRFIVISNGRGTYFSTAGYFDIDCPASGTITGVGGASDVTATVNGIPLTAWQALYYILPIGSNNGSVAANFRVASYTADSNIPYNWVLICTRNGDSGFCYFNNGIGLKTGESIDANTYTTRRSAIADTLTTTRTIWGQNFNGSANVTGALSGVTTLSMNNQLTNTLAIGTAPFVITSTTRVSNLNVATAGTADTWTTGRTLTIGSTGKSVNGSANVSWSLAEIGAMATGSSATNSVDIRAPIFYDSVDTTFYVDPNSESRLSAVLRTQSRVDNAQRYPIGHYTPGETVFELDPTWTQNELRRYFNSDSIQWLNDSTSPGGYAIQINGAVSVGGVYGSGFPYIPVDQNDIFYMECWIRSLNGSQTHYMGSMDFNQAFGNLGGNPGSFGYWTMSNATIGTTWTKVTGYITGFGTAVGTFVSGTKYWTPQALFNYTQISGTYACVISGWKVIKVAHVGDRTFRGSIRAAGDITAYFSDARLKTFEGIIPDALDKVNSLHGYYFYENELAKSLGYNNDKRQVGVSAQEVQKIMPEVVVSAPIDSNYLTVKYEKLVPLLIEAINELTHKVESLEATINGKQ